MSRSWGPSTPLAPLEDLGSIWPTSPGWFKCLKARAPLGWFLYGVECSSEFLFWGKCEKGVFSMISFFCLGVLDFS